jgi:hypothetical protein
VPGLPVRPGVHELGLGERDERARRRIENNKSKKQHNERAGRCHPEQREHEQDAPTEDDQPTTSPVPGQHAERQLEKAARQQRHRSQQPDLFVTQAQVVPDERERGSLGPVN